MRNHLFSFGTEVAVVDPLLTLRWHSTTEHLGDSFANEETGPAEKGRETEVMTIFVTLREKPIIILLLFFRQTFGRVIVSEVSMRPAHRTAVLFAVITKDRNKV